MNAKGIVAGSYSCDKQAEAFGRMSLAERIVAVHRDACELHKEFASKTLVPSSKAVSIAWHHVEGQSGGSALRDSTNSWDNRAYQRLLTPDGRFFVIGDQVSPLPGWLEGAFLSSEHAVLQIAGRRSTLVSELNRAPETNRLMRSMA